MASTSSGASVDQDVVESVVNYVKSAGLFDQFRRDCLNDVDTKPAYQNLRQRVEGYVSNFLSKHTWSPNLNKNQLRDSLRRQIHQSEMLSMGVERIVEQVVEPKIQHILRPQIEKAFQEYMEKKQEETPPVATASDDSKATLPIIPSHSGTPPSSKAKIKVGSEKAPPDIPTRVRTSSTSSDTSGVEKSSCVKPAKATGEQQKKQVTDPGSSSESKSKIKESGVTKPSKDVKKVGGKLPEKSKMGSLKTGSLKSGEGKKPEQGSGKGKAGEADKSGKGDTHPKSKLTEQSGQVSEKSEKVKVGDSHQKVKVDAKQGDKQKPFSGDKSGTRKSDQKGGSQKDDRQRSDSKDRTEVKGSLKEEKQRTESKEKTEGKGNVKEERQKADSKDKLEGKVGSKDDKQKSESRDKTEGKASSKEDKARSDKIEGSKKSDSKDKIEGGKTEHVKSGEKSDKQKLTVKSKDSSDKSKPPRDQVSKLKTDKGLKNTKDEKAKSTKSEVPSEKKGNSEVKVKSSGEGKLTKDVVKKERPKEVNKDKKAVAGKDKDGSSKQKDPVKSKSDVKKKTDIKIKSETTKAETKVKGNESSESLVKESTEKKEDSVKGKVQGAAMKGSKDSKKEVKKEVTEKKADKPKETKNLPVTSEKVVKKPDETLKPEKVQVGTDQKDSGMTEETAPSEESKTTATETEQLPKTESVVEQATRDGTSQPGKADEENKTIEEAEHKDDDFLDDDNLSDVTVSSVHTSDLSSFEDEISSVSSVSSSSEDLSSDGKDDTDRSLSKSRDSPFGSISGDSEKSGQTKRRPSTKALALNRYYSDSEDEESREERRKKAAKEKEERAARRQQIKEDMNEAWKKNEEEKKKKREEKKKVKQMTKEKEEVEKGRSGRRGRTKEQKKEEKVQAKREQKVLEKRMALRRQRTLNKKYLSEDFTSLFSQKEPTFITGEGDSSDKQTSEPPAATDVDSETSAQQAARKRSHSRDAEENPGSKPFFVSNVPDVGPSYEQTFLAKALELGNYSCGLRRSGRRSSVMTDAGEGLEQGLPPKRGRRISNASGSSSDHSSGKGHTDSQSGKQEKEVTTKEGKLEKEMKETVSGAEQESSALVELTSPATPTQDEPSFLDESIKDQTVVATVGDSPIPIYSLSSHVDHQQSPLKSISASASEMSREEGGKSKEQDQRDTLPDSSTEKVPKEARGQSSKSEEEPGTWNVASGSQDRPKRHHRETRRHSSRHDSHFYNDDDSKSPGANPGVRPRRQSTREHYKPMSDQFDYYGGKKPHQGKEEEPRRRHSSHSPRDSRSRNSPPPRESRSRKRHASPPKEHRQSKYRGYSHRR